MTLDVTRSASFCTKRWTSTLMKAEHCLPRGASGRNFVGPVNSKSVWVIMGSFVEGVGAQVLRGCAMGDGVGKD